MLDSGPDFSCAVTLFPGNPRNCGLEPVEFLTAVFRRRKIIRHIVSVSSFHGGEYKSAKVAVFYLMQSNGIIEVLHSALTGIAENLPLSRWRYRGRISATIQTLTN
jgi:hypothetical protein